MLVPAYPEEAGRATRQTPSARRLWTTGLANTACPYIASPSIVRLPPFPHLPLSSIAPPCRTLSHIFLSSSTLSLDLYLSSRRRADPGRRSAEPRLLCISAAGATPRRPSWPGCRPRFSSLSLHIARHSALSSSIGTSLISPSFRHRTSPPGPWFPHGLLRPYCATPAIASRCLRATGSPGFSDPQALNLCQPARPCSKAVSHQLAGRSFPRRLALALGAASIGICVVQQSTGRSTRSKKATKNKRQIQTRAKQSSVGRKDPESERERERDTPKIQTAKPSNADQAQPAPARANHAGRNPAFPPCCCSCPPFLAGPRSQSLVPARSCPSIARFHSPSLVVPASSSPPASCCCSPSLTWFPLHTVANY